MSYIRDEKIQDGSTLPAIRTSLRAWEAPAPPRRVILEETIEDRIKYSPSNSYYPRPPSATHRQTEIVHDQINFYKDEIAKKDRLISQLTSMDTPRTKVFDTSKIDEYYSTEKITAIASVKSENAALQVRIEGLQSQLRDTQVQLELREEKIKEMRLHLETSRESESKQNALVNSLRAKIAEFEAQANSLEGAASRSEVAIVSLQKECTNYQNRVLELETKLKQYQGDRERVEQDRTVYEQRYREIVAELHSLCNIDGYSGSGFVSIDIIRERLTDLISENSMLKGKISTLKEHCNTAELESKASRETIVRLMSEQEREQRSVSRFSQDMESLRLERDSAVDRQRELEREIDLMRERLDANQRALTVTQRELEEREVRFTSADRELRERSLITRNVETQYRSLKETLAGLLSDSFHSIDPSEEMIRDRIQNIVLALRDKNAHIEVLEAKVDNLAKQLDDQTEHYRGSERKSKRLEADFLDMEDRLRKYESEMAAGEMMRDGLRVDKERYLRFLERIVHAMKMEAITMDLGVESITDAIIARSEQLVRMEADNIVDRKTQIYNLQRKVKSMKEQLDSKELHMDLLRKKMSSYEERALSKTELEREREEEVVKSRKLIKLVDRYKRELNEARLEIRDLKSRLLESSDIRSRTLEQEREIEGLEAKVGQLETVRQKQASKLKNLKSDYDDTLNEFTTKKTQTQTTIQALSGELRSIKQTLDEMRKRERQLLDLRQVIARMLGMDVNSLAVPDYEIIARLEKLILANQTNASTAIVLDTALQEVGEGFRAGYEDAARALAATAASTIVPRSQTSTRRSGINLRTRPRSASPGRSIRRDTRSY